LNVKFTCSAIYVKNVKDLFLSFGNSKEFANAKILSEFIIYDVDYSLFKSKHTSLMIIIHHPPFQQAAKS